MRKAHKFITLFVCILLQTACAGGGLPSAESAGNTPLPFVENFDDSEACFDPGTASFAVQSIENGELIIEVNESRKLFWSTCEALVLDNFTFEMDVYDDTSGEGLHFFGLQFRKGPVEGDADQYYLVRFGLGGGDPPASCAGIATDNSWIGNLTESPSGDSCWVDLPEPIQTGEWNHFEITANGSEITYKVNDTLVASVDDSRLTQGTIALLAGTNDGNKARIKIDKIHITAPTD